MLGRLFPTVHQIPFSNFRMATIVAAVLQLSQISLPVDHPPEALRKAAARTLRVPVEGITKCEVFKQSIDARRKAQPGVRFNYLLDVETTEDEATLLARHERNPAVRLKPDTTYAYATPPKSQRTDRPLVIGAGPCGMFAALQLANAGLRPIILERGKPAGPRARDVTRFWREGGEVDPDSNVQFGEGGAGTFSDGKLYTGIKDREHRIRFLLEELVAHEAPPDILIKGKPHIGTDRLIKVVRNIRARIEALGGEYRFETRVTGLRIDDDAIHGVSTDSGEELEASTVILAVGHSARDTFEMLHELGIPMEPKPFSIGARIEHPQSLINRSLYGKDAGNARLGSAPYKFVQHIGRGKDARSAYSFCMCPGGLVVACSSEAGGVVTNGMSSYARSDANANSGFMIDLHPDDYAGATDDPLAGVRFQRELERKAFSIGGSNYHAPAQLLGDLMKGRASRELHDVRPSYRPGVTLGDLRDVLPEFVIENMRRAIPRIARNLPGFDTPGAILTGVETRSSSPLRILRDRDTLQSPAVRGLYPAGEGAGYAGGIISAAADGLRVTEAILG